MPTYIRQDDQLLRLARAIYPHWRDRKIMRRGAKIIPQLDVDEPSETEPYGCFRRRDGKQVRKTRRTDTTPAEKVSRLRVELAQASDIAMSVVAREVKKSEAARDNLTLLDLRIKLVDLKRRYPQFAILTDDQMLVDPERAHVPPKIKRNHPPGLSVGTNFPGRLGPGGVGAGGAGAGGDVNGGVNNENTPVSAGGVLKIPRRQNDGKDVLTSQFGEVGEAGINPHERAAAISRDIERLLESKKQTGWEDYLDVCFALFEFLAVSY